MSSEEERKRIKDIATEETLKLFNERPDEIILQELKDAYNRQWDLKDSDEKGNWHSYNFGNNNIPTFWFYGIPSQHYYN